MGDIKAFMQPSIMEMTDKVYLDRFKDEKGNVVPFEIRGLSQEVNEGLYNQASRPVRKNGVVVGKELDNNMYTNLVIITSCTSPNFKDAELCAYYKTKDPLEVPGRMLSTGEFAKLSKAIFALSGTNLSDDDVKTLEEEAKN